ncbi:MAG TPA: ATP-binding protein [Burkholderiales bacterium]|jgi:PAS domain S-box-containing protein
MSGDFFDPVIQTILVGFTIQAGAAAAFFFLYAAHRSHRYLLLWGWGATLFALRWPLHYAGETEPVVRAIEAVLASGALICNLLGAYELMPRKPFPERGLLGVLALAFAAAVITGELSGRLVETFYALVVGVIVAMQYCFWQGYRATRLSGFIVVGAAYLLQAIVLAVLQIVWGPGVRNSVIGPLLNLFTIGGFILIGFQITERQRGAAESTLRRFFDTAPIPIVICRAPGGEIEQVNQAAVDLGGVPAAEAIGKTAAQIGIVADESGRRTMYEALKAGDSISGLELAYLHAGREKKLFAVNASPLPLDDGPRYIFVLYDISELRRTQRELALLNAGLERQVAERTRDLEMFAYSLSHDLRGPLRAINGFSALLLERPEFDTETRHLLTRIFRNGERMNQLVDAVLGYSRDSTKNLTPAPCALDPLLDHFLGDYRLQYPGTALAVRPLGHVLGDATLLQQVLENLVSNACKYSARREQPRVDIWRSEEDGNAVLHVRDNGCGFDMKHAPRLFNLFQRMHTSAQYEGIGVGLAVVKRFVERMDGRVEVEAAQDAGATFRIVLPAAPDVRETVRVRES